MLSVDCCDGIEEPRVPGVKPVRGRASDGETLTFGRQNSMSLLQAPNRAAVEGGVSVTDRGIDPGRLPVVSGDNIGRSKAGAGGKSVRSSDQGSGPVDRHHSMSELQALDNAPIDGNFGSGPPPVGRHHGMSPLQAPKDTRVDGSAGVVGIEIGASISIVDVGCSMPLLVVASLSVDPSGVKVAVFKDGAEATVICSGVPGFMAVGGLWLLRSVAFGAADAGRPTRPRGSELPLLS